MSRAVSLDKYPAEIIEERYNPLIKRYELKIKVAHIGEGTPSRGLLKLALSKLYNRDAGLVIIRNVSTEYGLQISVVEAHIYDDEKRLRLFEPEYVIKRNEESLSKIPS